MDEITKLQSKLDALRRRLQVLETDGAEKIRCKRVEADMGDDFRENEGAKLVMEDHNMLHLQIFNLKKEIFMLKKQILTLKQYQKA